MSTAPATCNLDRSESQSVDGVGARWIREEGTEAILSARRQNEVRSDLLCVAEPVNSNDNNERANEQTLG